MALLEAVDTQELVVGVKTLATALDYTDKAHIGSALHRSAALAAEREGIKLNEFLKQAVSDKLERNY